MQFPYVDICAILSDDRIYDRAVKPLITKEAQERDVVDPGRLKEAAAFERILREYASCASFIFATARSLDLGSEWTILKGFPIKEPLGRAMDIQVKSAPTSRPTER